MPNQFIRIQCTDPLGNIAFVVQRPSGTWRCELLLGTPCSFIFCGVASADAADLIFALEACSTAQHALETVMAYSRSPRSWGYELLADPETPTHRLSTEPQTVCSPTDIERQVESLRSALSLCVKAIDNLLPGAKHIVADVGLINEALMAARPLCKEA